jgi:peptidoglycan DL-endopeptidase CwlO
LSTPVEVFKTKIGINNPTQRGVGYSYSPTILQQGNDPGKLFLEKLNQRKTSGNDLYSNRRQGETTRVANDLIQKSAGLKFDEWGKPDVQLGDFGSAGQTILKSISQHGNLATQTAEAKKSYQQAVAMQNIGSYGLSGSFSVDAANGTVIPGASANNVGARAASMAMQVAKNHVPYVWGGNNLATGVDCSALVQQIYKQLGITVPRVTYDQAKQGKQVPVNDIRPGDLVFYRPGSRGPEHVGIYVGNGKIVHAANPSLGVITSNLNNSNGAPILVLRPY